MQTEQQQDNDKAEAAIAAALTGSLDTTRCIYCGEPADMVCDDCEARAHANNAALAMRHEADAQEARQAAFNQRIPDDYQGTDPDRLPNWSRQIVDLWNPLDRYGVTLVGPAESGKTRTAVLLLQKAFLRKNPVRFEHAGNLRRFINRMARDGDDHKAIAELAAEPFLAIDDIGNNAWTETAEEFYLLLLETRTNKRRPTICTSQFPADEFIGKASNRRVGTAIARRIGPEYAWIVNVETGHITSPRQPGASPR